MNRVYVAMQDGVDEPEWFENVEPFVLKALNAFNFDGEEVSVLLCEDAYMQELNKAYRDIDSTTDVLSFVLSFFLFLKSPIIQERIGNEKINGSFAFASERMFVLLSIRSPLYGRSLSSAKIWKVCRASSLYFS